MANWLLLLWRRLRTEPQSCAHAQVTGRYAHMQCERFMVKNMHCIRIVPCGECPNKAWIVVVNSATNVSGGQARVEWHMAHLQGGPAAARPRLLPPVRHHRHRPVPGGLRGAYLFPLESRLALKPHTMPLAPQVCSGCSVPTGVHFVQEPAVALAAAPSPHCVLASSSPCHALHSGGSVLFVSGLALVWACVRSRELASLVTHWLWHCIPGLAYQFPFCSGLSKQSIGGM